MVRYRIRHMELPLANSPVDIPDNALGLTISDTSDSYEILWLEPVDEKDIIKITTEAVNLMM